MSGNDPGERFSISSAVVAIHLTLAAGDIDAIGYLRLGHVYIAHMSGNSIAAGIGTGWRDTSRMLHYGAPVASFFAGLLSSPGLVNWGIDHNWLSLAAPALGLESSALVGLLASSQTAPSILLGGGKGIRAATLSRFNGATVYTCFVPGSLEGGREPGGCGDVIRVARQLQPDTRPEWGLVLSVWVAYVGGAMLGAMALGGIGVVSVALAIAAIGALAVCDLMFPSRFGREVET